MSYSDRMSEFFSSLAESYPPDDVRRMGWGSRESQWVRFEALAGVGDLEGCSVLDIGAGIGDFYQFLRDRGFEGRYLGYDLLAENVAVAEERWGKGVVVQRDFMEVEPAEPFDYVVASGIFFLPIQLDEVAKMVGRLFALAERGLAVNFLSTLSKNPSANSKYFSPEEILGILTSLTSRFVIRHDYRGNDFTVYAYR